MLAFASMLVDAAQKAGIEIPPDPNDYDKITYLRFFIFEYMQIGRRCPYPGCHFHNAYIIANIPEDQLKTITPEDILRMGFV